MAKLQQYSYDPDHPHYTNIISYGKCENPEHAKDNLWFVNISHEPQYIPNAKQEHTFFVPQEYARPEYFNAWQRDLDKWREVAVSFETGSWNPVSETLYKNAPVYEYTFPDGVQIRYGASGIQPWDSLVKTGRETASTLDDELTSRVLYYVVFAGGPLFLVDEKLCTSEYLEKIGSDALLWMILCWHMEEELSWSDYSDFARLRTRIAIDPPHSLPRNFADIEKKIDDYKDLVKRFLAEYSVKIDNTDRGYSMYKRHGIFNRPSVSDLEDLAWNRVYLHDKVNFLENWTRKPLIRRLS